MYYWAINTFLVFISGVLFTGFLIPRILHVSFLKNLYDAPCERSVHRGNVPRLGGVAFGPAILFSMVVLTGVNLALGHPDILLAAVDDSLALSLGFCAAMVLYLVGMMDDLAGVRYRAKFAAMLLCSAMLVTGGVWIGNLYGIAGIHALPAWIGYPFSALAIMLVINAINLIDGIDGLASGLSCLALLFYGSIFLLLHKYVFAMISFATLGVLASFFYHNVFGRAELGRKIFMGDTGSLTAGIILCFLGIELFLCIPDGSLAVSSPHVAAFSPLIIPCFDTVHVFIRRIRSGKNPFMPDRGHIHHRLLAAGMSQRGARTAILLASLLFTAGNVLLLNHVNANILLAGDALVWIVCNILLAGKTRRREINRQHSKSTVIYSHI